MFGSGLAGVWLGVDRLQAQLGHEASYPFSANADVIASLQFNEHMALSIKRILGVDGIDRIQFGLKVSRRLLVHDELVIVDAAGQTDQRRLLGYAESFMVGIDERCEPTGPYVVSFHRLIRWIVFLSHNSSASRMPITLCSL